MIAKKVRERKSKSNILKPWGGLGRGPLKPKSLNQMSSWPFPQFCAKETTYSIHKRVLYSVEHYQMTQCVTRSLFQFSRREREFLSFNLMFETRSRIFSLNLVPRDENENFFFQSQASRQERESRLRQFSREFSGIIFIAFLLTDIFKKGC